MIRAAFPTLTMNLELRPKHVDLAMDIPSQLGLSFKVHLNLQNIDELHLCASALWVEWFPCTNVKRVEEYFEAVCGLLTGQFRIVECWRGTRAVSAKLQAPKVGTWKTIARWSVLLSIPWPPKRRKIVQNVARLA